LAYLFNTTPINELLDSTTGEIYKINSEYIQKLMEKHNTSTAEGLLAKVPSLKLHSREEVLFKQDIHLKIDGFSLKGFNRETFETNKNIFEVVDSIINLAIDNVKMQKLHLLGITNNNANLFLSLIGMGVPLNTTSLIFKTPIINNLSEGKRIEVDSFSEVINALLKDSSNYTEELTDLLKEKYPRNYQLQLIKLQSKDTSFLASSKIDSRTLERIYTGEASKAEKFLHDLIVLENLKKLVPVGEELFSQAQMYSPLKGLPNKK